MSRPSDYDEDVADLICRGIAEGKSLRAICRDESLPDKATVFRWLAAHDDFATKYARAREVQAEFHHDEMDRIERGVLKGRINAQAASVVLTNKRWRMEKLKPKVYGTAVTLKGDKDNPLQIRKAPELSDEELAALAAGGLREAT